MDLSQIPDFVKLALFIFFCVVIAIQLFYTFLFCKAGKFQSPCKTASQEYPVSVIICARDEAENIANNLPGILGAAIPHNA